MFDFERCEKDYTLPFWGSPGSSELDWTRVPPFCENRAAILQNGGGLRGPVKLTGGLRVRRFTKTGVGFCKTEGGTRVQSSSLGI